MQWKLARCVNLQHKMGGCANFTSERVLKEKYLAETLLSQRPIWMYQALCLILKSVSEVPKVVQEMENVRKKNQKINLEKFNQIDHMLVWL